MTPEEALVLLDSIEHPEETSVLDEGHTRQEYSDKVRGRISRIIKKQLHVCYPQGQLLRGFVGMVYKAVHNSRKPQEL